jgi:hypothetical protein
MTRTYGPGLMDLGRPRCRRFFTKGSLYAGRPVAGASWLDVSIVAGDVVIGKTRRRSRRSAVIVGSRIGSLLDRRAEAGQRMGRERPFLA